MEQRCKVPITGEVVQEAQLVKGCNDDDAKIYRINECEEKGGLSRHSWCKNNGKDEAIIGVSIAEFEFIVDITKGSEKNDANKEAIEDGVEDWGTEGRGTEEDEEDEAVSML